MNDIGGMGKAEIPNSVVIVSAKLQRIVLRITLFCRKSNRRKLGEPGGHFQSEVSLIELIPYVLILLCKVVTLTPSIEAARR